MKLSSRFALDLVYLTAGAFLLVAAMAFTAGTAGWLAFAAGAGLTLLAGLNAVRATQPATRIGHGIVAVAALWSLVAALTFTGATQTWLVFANAGLLALLAVADLVNHEVTTERVVHELVVQHDQTVAEPLRAA
ncbi:hypothetical protein SAMN05421812_10326 [Asanoa hainanensis]|uniref:Uncharacterized protein n=1 Tax=Asanoa hainanensis TaxID=560556 RepID=A0A239JQ64_9ACTN|nr:hypothetical protein [Asanoa hainanensis]SNT06924.1 hypothetical protein SAMN05421812_10326 [Asanoa hainanensis]